MLILFNILRPLGSSVGAGRTRWAIIVGPTCPKRWCQRAADVYASRGCCERFARLFDFVEVAARAFVGSTVGFAAANIMENAYSSYGVTDGEGIKLFFKISSFLSNSILSSSFLLSGLYLRNYKP